MWNSKLTIHVNKEKSDASGLLEHLTVKSVPMNVHGPRKSVCLAHVHSNEENPVMHSRLSVLLIAYGGHLLSKNE